MLFGVHSNIRPCPPRARRPPCCGVNDSQGRCKTPARKRTPQRDGALSSGLDGEGFATEGGFALQERSASVHPLWDMLVSEAPQVCDVTHCPKGAA